MPASDTMCPIFGIQNEHYPGDNFKLFSLMLSKTDFKRSTCSSKVLEKTITSSMEIQHMCRCKSDKHACINRWYVPGEFDNPNGIMLYSYNPKGPTVKIVLSLCSSYIST